MSRFGISTGAAIIIFIEFLLCADTVLEARGYNGKQKKKKTQSHVANNL